MTLDSRAAAEPIGGIPFLKAAVLAASMALASAVSADAPPIQGAPAADLAARQNATQMKRFIVSAARVAKPWRYASLPGFEILTRAPPKETQEMLDSLRRGLWLENSVMPKDWLPSSPVPYTVIIDDTDLTTVSLGQPQSKAIILESPADAASWGPLGQSAMIWSDQLPAYDDDTFAFNVDIFGVDVKGVTYGSISMERLARCAPPLPKWLVAGLIGKSSGIFREGVVPLISKGAFDAGWIRLALGPGSIWVSIDETKRIADGAAAAIPPLATLFSGGPPTADALPVWESEAALFVRWGLIGPGSEDPATAHALQDFVRRARKEPVTEKVFTECFGCGYAAMEAKLGAYLKAVVNKPITIDLDMPAGFPRPSLAPATADQVGRILGDWLRMEGDSLRKSDPEMCKESLYFAGRTLVRAYKEDNGLAHKADPAVDADPAAEPSPARAAALGALDLSADKIHDSRLLAVLGLYAHDAGRNDKALEFLGSAAGSHVVRPRAYGVLAQVLMARASAKPEGSRGKIGAAQLAAILGPLREALRSEPSAEAYRLLIAAWAHAEAQPGDSDFAEIVNGAALFPRDVEMAYNAALLCAIKGRPEQAGNLIDRGLAFAGDDAARRSLELLRARLEVPGGSGGN
jgi:hypothetical protein